MAVKVVLAVFITCAVALIAGLLIAGSHHPPSPAQQWLNCLQSNIDNGSDNYCPPPPAP